MSRIVDSYLESKKEEGYMSFRLAFSSESIANARLDSRLTGRQAHSPKWQKENSPLTLKGKTCQLRTSLPLNAEGRASSTCIHFCPPREEESKGIGQLQAPS